MTDVETRVELRTGAGELIFGGTQSDFKGAAERVRQTIQARRSKTGQGAGMAKDETKMKETEADVHVREKAYRVTAGELRAFIERVERLEQDKSEIQEAIKQVYAESKARGYDTKAIRKLIAERKRDPADLEEEQTVMDLYREVLGT